MIKRIVVYLVFTLIAFAISVYQFGWEDAIVLIWIISLVIAGNNYERFGYYSEIFQKSKKP